MSSKKGMVTAKQTPDKVQFRDTFETPRYATELLLPFIPKGISWIWECAAGKEKISKVLNEEGYGVFSSDLVRSGNVVQINFLTDSLESKPECIITNPPFSIKHKFIERAFEYDVPFAFLINGDYSGQMVHWIYDMGCQKIIPTSRINYITPNILERVHEGEVWNIMQKESPVECTLREFKRDFKDAWKAWLFTYVDVHNYTSLYDCPQELLAKYSSSQFHSIWLTWKFDLGQTETFVELTPAMKKNIL